MHGSISFNSPNDKDVYSFTGTAGTQVWFQIAKTSPSLDTVLDLVDAAGNVLATSDNALAESLNPALLATENASNPVKPLPLELGDFSASANPNGTGINPHLYSENLKDAGFRLVLPGTLGATNTYYIRVSSHNGQTNGNYQLQIRLQDQPEVPGSTVQFADIRAATNGILAQGLPDASPLTSTATNLVSTSGSTIPMVSNTTFNNAQDLGNLLASDQGMVSVSSALLSAADVDWFKFTLTEQEIQSLLSGNSTDKSWATIFNVDYASQLGRPDLTLSVFDSLGNLMYVSRGSNVTDSQSTGLNHSASSILSSGSSGPLDPFLGTVQLPAGASKTYYVAISSDAALPADLNQTFNPTPTNSLIRLEPVDSVQRIVEDHIGSTGYQTSNGTIVQPTTPAILPINDQLVPNPNPTTQPGPLIQQLNANIVPYALADVPLFVSQTLPPPFGQGGTQEPTRLYTVNPSTGVIGTDLGYVGNINSKPLTTIAMRSDGILYGDQIVFPASGTAGMLDAIDPTTAQPFTVGKDNIPDAPGGKDAVGKGATIGAVTFVDIGVATRYQVIMPTDVEHYGMYYAVIDAGGVSHLFFGNPSDGSANIVGTQYKPDPQGPVGDNQKGSFQAGDGTLYMDPNSIIQDINLTLPDPGSIVTGQTFSITDTTLKTVTFYFIVGAGNPPPGDVGIHITGSETPNQLSSLVENAIKASGLATITESDVSAPNLTPPIPMGVVRLLEVNGATAGKAPGTTQVVVTAQPFSTFSDVGPVTGMVDVQQKGLSMFVPDISTIIDGQTFSLSDAERTVTFQFQLPSGKPALSPNNVVIPLTGHETFLTMATEIQAAIVQSGLKVTVTANSGTTFFPGELDIDNAFDASPGTSQMTFSDLPNSGWSLYGVTSTGQFISMANEGGPFGLNENFSALPATTGMVTNIVNFGPKAPFAGLALAPQNLYGGALHDVMFAITTNGDIYAIDYVTGQMISQIPGTTIDLFPNGATHVSTGLANATGLAFSTVDANLWHPTNQDASDPGHGINPAADNSREQQSTSGVVSPASTSGGSSYYFGLENTGGGYITYNQISSYGVVNPNEPWGNAQFGMTLATLQSVLTAYAPGRLMIASDNSGEVNLPPVLAANTTLAQDVIEGNNYNAPGGDTAPWSPIRSTWMGIQPLTCRHCTLTTCSMRESIRLT